MYKKNMVRAAVISLVLLGVTECTMIVAAPALGEFTEPATQTLRIEKPLNIIDVVKEDVTFARFEVDIVEVAPWLKPENQEFKLSNDGLTAILLEAGFDISDVPLALQIIELESHGRPYAHNQNSKTGDNSYGLFQINMIGSMGPARLEAYGLEANEDLFDPLTNAKVAYEISKGGTNWNAWTTYKKISG